MRAKDKLTAKCWVGMAGGGGGGARGGGGGGGVGLATPPPPPTLYVRGLNFDLEYMYIKEKGENDDFWLDKNTVHQ